MKLALAILGVTVLLTTSAFAIEPIPGSLTYGGQPKTRLKQAPAGSLVMHDFDFKWSEIYVIQPDRSLKLVRRWRVNH